MFLKGLSMSIYQPPKKSAWQEFWDGADDAGVLLLVIGSMLLALLPIFIVIVLTGGVNV